jgi:sugar phosphate isomerase/epimerase
MKTGLVSITFRECSVREIIKLAKENNLKSIEWGSTPHVEMGNVKLARKVKRLMHGAGLTCDSYGSYYGIVYREGVHKPCPFKKACKTAVALGAKTIRIWPGFPGMGEITEHDEMKAAMHTREICNIAKKYGLTLSMECHMWTITDNYERAIRFIKRVGCDNLKIYWQPNPMMNKEYNLEAAKALFPYVTNVHVCHWIKLDKKPLS